MSHLKEFRSFGQCSENHTILGIKNGASSLQEWSSASLISPALVMFLVFMWVWNIRASVLTEIKFLHLHHFNVLKTIITIKTYILYIPRVNCFNLKGGTEDTVECLEEWVWELREVFIIHHHKVLKYFHWLQWPIGIPADYQSSECTFCKWSSWNMLIKCFFSYFPNKFVLFDSVHTLIFGTKELIMYIYQNLNTYTHHFNNIYGSYSITILTITLQWWDRYRKFI